MANSGQCASHYVKIKRSLNMWLDLTQKQKKKKEKKKTLAVFRWYENCQKSNLLNLWVRGHDFMENSENQTRILLLQVPPPPKKKKFMSYAFFSPLNLSKKVWLNSAWSLQCVLKRKCGVAFQGCAVAKMVFHLKVFNQRCDTLLHVSVTHVMPYQAPQSFD